MNPFYSAQTNNPGRKPAAATGVKAPAAVEKRAAQRLQ